MLCKKVFETKVLSDKKGQIFSVDLAISMVAFIILFIIIIGFWNLYSLRLNERIAVEEANLLAIQITDILINSEGVPVNWEQQVNNAEVIGLKDSSGMLSQEKVNALLSIGMFEFKQLFNIERFEYQLKLADREGNILFSMGFVSHQYGKETVSVQRMVLLQNQTTYLTLTLSQI